MLYAVTDDVKTRKIQFREKSLSAFWLSVSTEYPLLSNKAVNILLPFTTTYLCETAFSAVTNMKTKYRSRLVVENDMRVGVRQLCLRIGARSQKSLKTAVLDNTYLV